MRGRDFAFAVLISAERITPAYAGKSKLPLLDYSPAWDHPRVCGEEAPVFLSLMARTGSPPRMRGRVQCFFPSPFQAVDHPRVCGEESRRSTTSKRSKGSPPRMRGRACCAPIHDLVTGITPAYAGKSRLKYLHGNAKWDHPRVCGEENSRGHHLYAG